MIDPCWRFEAGFEIRTHFKKKEEEEEERMKDKRIIRMQERDCRTIRL